MAISTAAWNLLYLLLLPSAVVADPQLAHVADSKFILGQSVTALGTPGGDYIYVPITHGWFNTTDGLSAQIIPGGSDYARGQTDGSGRLDVTVAAQDTASPYDLFYIKSTGYIAAGTNPGTANFTLEYGGANAWQMPIINTASEKYNWLNGAALVGEESFTVVNGETKSVSLRIYQVIVDIA